MRHLCQKVPIWGVYGAFRSAISSALPSVAPEVQNFGTGRSIFGGLVPYISAPETPNSGICIIHMGSKTRIFGGNGMRARSLYSGVLSRRQESINETVLLTMFLSKRSDVYLDLSAELRELQDWNIGTLRPIEYLLDIVSLAIEPSSGLLAVGMPRLHIQD